MSIVERLMQVPAFGRFALERLKKNAFNAFHIPLEKALENQTKALDHKFSLMEKIDIGKKLGVREGINIKWVPQTAYDFYAPFYNNPSPSAFMYPLEEYEKVKTSGTTGNSKWFLVPRESLRKVLRETALPTIFAMFHDGEKITMEYGDTLYLNLGPAPYISGSVFNMGSQERRASFISLVPNINLSYKEKVDYFVLNHKNIDGAWIMASTLIAQVIPALKEPIKLKGLMLMDDLVVRAHKKDIIEFTGTSPKTFYASTEAVAASIPSVQYSMAFIFDPRRGVFEFAPYEPDGKGEGEPVGLGEVKVGEIYRLIYTDLNGELTRYDTANSFKCIAKGDDIIQTDYPVFEYHSRLDSVISLMNFTRINEEELLEAFQIVNAKVIDFTARVISEGDYEYLYLYIELAGEESIVRLEKEIHQYLYGTDADYKMLVDSFGYIPIKLKLLPKNTFVKYLEKKGGVFPKVCRINMDNDEFDRLIS